MAKGSGSNQRVKVVEAYVDYTPALNYRRMVERLLETVPEKYLNGLDSVVLCNMSGVPRRAKRGTIRRRKRRMKRAHAAGLYHPAWRGQKPWIQLFVDQIPLPARPLRWIHPLCDLIFGSVFYRSPRSYTSTGVPEKEDVADSWAGRFAVNHIREAYWYLYPPLRLVGLISRWVRGKRPPGREA